jgi:translocation and assembly module TamB
LDDYGQPPRKPLDLREAKRRRMWKRILGWFAAGNLIVLIVVTGLTLLHSSRFHQYVIRVAQQKATAALGTQVLFRDYSLTFSGISPAVDLYDVVIAGAAPYPNPPLFTAGHMRVGVTVSSLLHRTWYLNEITLDRPIVRVLVDKHGADNLPTTTSNSRTPASVFDLGIRHARLNHGDAYYNNRKSVLDADLHDLTLESVFDTGQKKYSGTLSYRDGHLKMGTYDSLPHDLNASFSATPAEFALDRAVLSSGSSRIILKATLSDYSNPKIDGNYDAVLDTSELRRVMKSPSIPSGVIRTTGNAHYVMKKDVPMMAGLTVNGNLSSNALQVKTPTMATTVSNIGARYSVEHDNASVRDLRARLLGGELTGAMEIRDLTGSSHSHLQATVRGVQLADLEPLLNSQANSSTVNLVKLDGTVTATADAAWGKTMDDLVAHTDATVQGRGARSSGGAAFPLNGVIHARYAAASKQVTLDQSYVRMAQSSLTANGTISDRSALQIAIRSGDLHELEDAADLFRQSMQPLGLAGQASFNGSVTGTTSAPHVTGRLTATNLKVRGSSWRSMRANLDASPSTVSLQSGELDPADRGRISFAVRAGLSNWSFTNNSPIQVSLNASDINTQDLTKLAGSSAPVTGTLAANVQLSGTGLNPVGNGKMSLTHAKISSEPVKSVNLNFQGTGDEVHTTLSVQLPSAGRANAVVNYFPKNESYDAQLTANGIRLEQLQTVKNENLQIAGVLNVNANGRGTLKDPQLQATAQVPQLKIQNRTMNGITFNTNVANHVAKFVLDSGVLNTSARTHGTVNLTGNYNANVTIDTQAIPIAPLVAIYAPTQAGALTGQTELHAVLRGPLKDKTQLIAQITIPQLAVNYKNTVQIAAAAPIRADYANGVLTLQRAAIRGTGTDLQFQGSIPVARPNQPLAIMLLGTVDLKLAQLFDPDVTSGGQLKFNIDSTGSRANPNVAGQIQVVNASFTTVDLPVGMQNGNGVLTLTNDHLEITQFSGTVGGGNLTASGGVAYRPALHFNVSLQGQGMRLLYPGGIRATMGTQLALTGNMEEALLSGNVHINQLSFTPDFDLINFAGSLSGETTPPPTSGLSTILKLNIALQSTNEVNLVSRTLSVNGSANLRITGTAADPVVLGRVNINDGDVIFQGNRYVVNGGTIDFINPNETQPVVNLNLSTTIKNYDIQMRLWGPADRLHTNYSSDPALPPADIINLIAFGTTTEAAAANPQPGNLAAASALASQVSGQVTSRLAKATGISQLSIDPELGGEGSNQNPGARIAIQQRVTSNIFVTFATDVNSAQDQEIKVEFKVSPRLSINLVRDQNGGFAMDAQLHRRW